MSLYPRFTPTTTGARYNSSDIITKQDISSTSGSGTISLDLSGFMLKSAPVVSSDIYLSNEAGVKFTSGAKQTVPYSDDEVATVAESKLKTSAISYDSGTSKTTVLGTMDLSAADVQLADESVPIAKVVDLTSTIVQIQNNLVQIQTNLSNITSNDEELLALTAADVVHESRMDAIETLDAAQDVRLDAIETLDAAQDGRLDTLEPLVSYYHQRFRDGGCGGGPRDHKRNGRCEQHFFFGRQNRDRFGSAAEQQRYILKYGRYFGSRWANNGVGAGRCGE